MMRVGTVCLAILIWIGGCADEQARSVIDASVITTDGVGTDAEVIANEAVDTADISHLIADNVIIDDNGSMRTLGTFKIGFGQADPETGRMEFTRDFSAPTIAGPTVVYIFKSISAETVAQLDEHGIDAEENMAYLLPHGADAFSDVNAFKEMKRIGPIDPSLSDDELGSLFGLSKE